MEIVLCVSTQYGRKSNNNTKLQTRLMGLVGFSLSTVTATMTAGKSISKCVLMIRAPANYK